MSTLDEILAGRTVVPVLTIDRLEDAVPLARALVRGGLRVLEVTLRTPAAAAAAAIRDAVPDAVVALGTVVSEADVRIARDLGVPFSFSPGATPALLRAARDAGVALIPGVQTASELMAAMECGIRGVKFFPAGTAGGPEALRSFGGPFRGVRFCPTGGVSEANAPDWFAVPTVFAVGGSWIAPAKDVTGGQWAAIEERAARAAALAR